MPLHGKIVVIKRSGTDGTEFPLTATCLFGRKPDCDIRIQLPQVSKEHCRIDLNENKEVILTNLSSVNPTCVNGEALLQSERLKHGDVITIIDRSFRFEYPPAPTPKKRSSTGKTETLKVLQDQQVVDTVIVETGEKKISEVFTDGTNHENIQQPLEKTAEVDSSEDDSLLQNKTSSPFNDLYQMIKKSLDVKTPQKSSVSLLQTPTSRFCTPKPGSVKKNDGKGVISTEDKSMPKKDDAKVFTGADETKGEAVSISNGTPKSVKKQRKSVQIPSDMAGSVAEEADAVLPQKRNRATPQRFTVSEVIERVSAPTPKSPMRRRSKETTPTKATVTEEPEKAMTSPKTKHVQQSSPRNSGKAAKVDLPTSQMKRKRVSFGGHLSPELFDKRLPPDSPLRKGATPRRSLCLSKSKQSLLRRASVIGLLREVEPDSPSMQSPAKKRISSPKKSSNSKNASPRTPTPGKKSPKSASPSPKAASPGKKSPKSASPSPKAASPGKKSPKSASLFPKAASPGKKSPKSASSSPKAASPGRKSPKSKTTTPARGRSPSTKTLKSSEPPKTPHHSGIFTSTGRFSVSRISTPSPVAEDAVTDKMPLVTVTPKIPLRRKSMKSTTRKTPSISRSAVKVIRRSGISRASIKVRETWSDIVKFGQTKAQVAAPAKRMVTKKTTTKAVPKPQTPARKLKGHASTGHADSPVTIFVGKAHKQKIAHPTGAAPRLVTNTALLKKNMKMDEDLSGISEMFKTPANGRRRRTSVINDSSATETPMGALATSVVEPSVLNTPEEPDEMMVSPLSVTSTVKGRRYNSEAVQRLLDGDQESSFISEIPALQINPDESTELQCTDVKTTNVTPPKQKPQQPECLTGVKRLMRTPKQKAEPVEDIRGKLLVTPKQKPEQQECLTGVKRIMKTPRQKAEPVEDIRGKLLVTPKQKPEQQECLTGVKRIFKTPQQEAELLEDLQGKLLNTSKTQEAGDGVEELQKTPAYVQEAEDLPEMTDMKTPKVKSSPLVCLTGVKRIMKTPKEKSAPVEDMVGVKRLMKTPREKAEPVENNFGIKALMRSPRLRGIAPVEGFEGLQELMEEPLTDLTGAMKTNEVEDQTPPDCGLEIAKELDFAHGELQGDAPSDVIDNVPQIDKAKEADANDILVHNHMTEVPSGVGESTSEEQPEVETANDKVTELDTTAEPDHEKKSARSRRAKTVETTATEDKQDATEESEDPVATAPVRGRRGKKTETTAPSTVRQATRNRNRDVELTVKESAPQCSTVALKPKRGRNAKKASENQAETVQEVAIETEMVPEVESKQIPSVDVNHKVNDSTPQEKAVSKPKRGRKAKQESEQSLSVPDVPHSDNVPQADRKKDANEVCSNQLEVVPDESKSLDAVETVSQVPITDSLPVVGTDSDAAVQKKPVRGRRAKMVEAQAAEDKQEASDNSEDPIVPAPVRGRRGKKTEATAPPAVTQTTRTKNAKSQGSTFDSTSEMVPDKSVEDSIQENKSAPPTEGVVVKPSRGRKAKQTPVEAPQPEPERSQVVGEEHLMVDPQPHVSIIVKSKRGRRTKADSGEQNEVTEDTVETKQQPEPPVRAKRGRNAKQEEEKKKNDGEATSAETPKFQEPSKKLRRTRKTEQDDVEPREEEIQTAETVVPKEAEASPVEPLKLNEQISVATKPRRGGRKARQDTESEIPVESSEVQEVSAVSSDKPKRGRRGKQSSEEVGVAIEVPEEKADHELEVEEKKTAEPDAPVAKPSRARGVKTVKTEVSHAIPAKRARRGAALPLEEAHPEPAVLVSESVPTSVEPPKRGRRAAAKPTTDQSTVSSEQANPSEDLNTAVVEDAKVSKRSVKWRSELEVFQIPKVTPVKAVRGRKSRLADQVEAESKNVSKAASKTEEKDLSDDIEAQPTKRARRAAKVADEAESSTKVDLKKDAGAETQPKTRRGRSAKK